MYMKRFVLFALAAGVMLAPVAAQAAYRLDAPAVSFELPEGWEVRDFPGVKYPLAFGPVEDGFAININLVVDSFAGSLDEYIAGSLAAFEQYFEDYTLLESGPFSAATGEPGAKVAVLSLQRKMYVAQTFYVFRRGTDFYVFTCSAPESAKDEYDPVFEGAMETLILD